MIFLFKKIVAPLLFPYPFILLLLIVGFILLFYTRRKKLGKILMVAGIALFAIIGYRFVPEYLLGSLEKRHPPLVELERVAGVKWIVVLGSGHISDPRLPANSQLGEAAVSRLVEGIRLHRTLPSTKLLLSGGAVFDPVANAEVMSDVALQLGVNQDDIVLNTASKDTKDEARHIKKILDDDSFILVTSASHMPRASALFRKQGMNPVPAPTDFWVKDSRHTDPRFIYPSVSGLRVMERAIYEYLGLAWARMRGQI